MSAASRASRVAEPTSSSCEPVTVKTLRWWAASVWTSNTRPPALPMAASSLRTLTGLRPSETLGIMTRAIAARLPRPASTGRYGCSSGWAMRQTGGHTPAPSLRTPSDRHWSSRVGDRGDRMSDYGYAVEVEDGYDEAVLRARLAL